MPFVLAQLWREIMSPALSLQLQLECCQRVSFTCCLRNTGEDQFSQPKPQKAEQEKTWEITRNLDLKNMHLVLLFLCFHRAETAYLLIYMKKQLQ